MKNILVSASILGADLLNLKKEILNCEKADVDMIHFDVMDGHFVPNLTFGPDILKGFRKMTDLVLDVHLMITDPEKYAFKFVEAGADMITFHVEALDNDIERCAKLVKDLKEAGVQAGVVIKPKTDVKIIESLLKEVDMVLVMTVEPGFGGQSFMKDMMPKVEWLDTYRNENELSYRIEVDGGINGKTYKTAVEAGSDTLVAGSYVFKGNIIDNIASLFE